MQINPCSLYIIKRKELNNLISSNRTILSNLQRIDSSKDELEEYHSSKEPYSSEISDLLKTSERTLDPYGYTPSPVENFGGVSNATPVETPRFRKNPRRTGSVHIRTQADDFPKQFNKTFEDSFTFGDESNFSFKNIPDTETGQSPEEEQIQNLSWDFTSIDAGEPETKIDAPATEEQKPEDTPQFQEESSPAELPGINWNFDAELESDSKD